MGYYADGSGYIRYKKLTQEQEDRVCAVLGDYMEYGSRPSSEKDSTTFDFWDSDKYHEDDVLHVLDELAEIAQIEEGAIEYVGEDYSFWRFLYVPPSNVRSKRGRWIEQNGRVVYDD